MANQFLGRADTSGNSEKLNAQAPNYYLDFNNFTATNLSVAANNITRRPIISTLINSVGYITRAAIGMQRGTTGWGEALFSVGNNDAGTSFVDFRFNTNGRIYSPAGTFALTGEAQPADGGNAATANSAAKWTTARTLSLTGHATGSVSIDGSANVSLKVNNNYATSAGRVALLYTDDTRDTNPAPSTYARGFQTEFKGNSSIGISAAGTYSGLITFAPWSDQSGGNAYQLDFAYDSNGSPILNLRTAALGSSAWGAWNYIPIMSTRNGYWGFEFPSNNTYLRTPPNGLLPYASGTSNSTVLGTSSWRFNSAYINTVYGSLSGNATTATTATNATQLGGVGASGYLRNTGGVLSGSTASISRAATGASWVNARNCAIFKMTTSWDYSPMWSAKTANGSWDCGTYTSNRLYFTYITDANFNANTNVATGQFYVDTDGSITAPAFKGNATSATTATNSTQLGGIAAASYINTSDTLILRGVV